MQSDKLEDPTQLEASQPDRVPPASQSQAPANESTNTEAAINTAPVHTDKSANPAEVTKDKGRSPESATQTKPTADPVLAMMKSAMASQLEKLDGLFPDPTKAPWNDDSMDEDAKTKAKISFLWALYGVR